MSAPTVALTDEDVRVLLLVAAERVAISRNRYFVLGPGQENVQLSVQRLRAMKLVVLARPPASANRTPPTRKCALTMAGELVVEGLR